MDLKPIPVHPNSVSIMLNDVWHGDLFCPFCGMKSVAFVGDELKAMPCPHLICATGLGAILYVSDLFMEKLVQMDSTLTYERVCDAGSVPWADTDGEPLNVSTETFCGIVPNSISITTFDSKTGEDMTVSFAPVDTAD